MFLVTRILLVCFLFFLMIRRPPRSTLFPYTTLFRSVNPYLAVESVRDLARRGVLAGDPKISEKKAEANLLKALGRGLLKIMSKMGVSTVASYTGAQIFEAIRLGPDAIETCFAGTTSP